MAAPSEQPRSGGNQSSLQIVGAGPAGMSLVLALANRAAAADAAAAPARRLLEGLHGFQSYPLTIAPRLLDSMAAACASKVAP